MRKTLTLLCLIAALALPVGCTSNLDIAPGAEAYQSQTDPDGKTTETRQGVRVRVGTITTQAAPDAAAEKVDDAAGKFKEGAADQNSAGTKVENASSMLMTGLILLGGLVFLAAVVLVVAMVLTRKRK